MTLPASGSISTDQIMAELRVANPSRAYPISLTDTDVRALAGVPSGNITLPNSFYGKSSFTSALHVYTSGTGATETAPNGCHTVVIEVWAGGEAGANANLAGPSGGGGGAGGYSRSSYPITGGQTLTYTVGTGGPSAASAGGVSSVSSGSLTITTMTCNGGHGASIPGGGTGGTASGGNQANTTGANGQSADSVNGDPPGLGAVATPGVNGGPYGGGGRGANSGISNGRASSPGASGGVVFSYT